MQTHVSALNLPTPVVEYCVLAIQYAMRDHVTVHFPVMGSCNPFLTASALELILDTSSVKLLFGVARYSSS